MPSNPPPIRHYVQQMRIFAGNAFLDVATVPQLVGLFVVADSRHD
jgi:hypothetical protein